MTVLALFMLVQCSLLPKGLKAFYNLPLSEIDRAFFDPEGFRMSYVRSGNPKGVPVVLVHGQNDELVHPGNANYA